ncbi:unnamed protein product [Amoebophrya sp. A25]|nr:unnamed protein product [Amoebophrya sp. A25]|eukprot:GSA25T00014642001.1
MDFFLSSTPSSGLLPAGPGGAGAVGEAASDEIQRTAERKTSDLVKLAQRGDVFMFSYIVGGGGGHELTVHWCVAGVSYIKDGLHNLLGEVKV